MTEMDNARRTLDKAEEVLKACRTYFGHQAQMNAQAHMSAQVMYSPIHAAVSGALYGISMFNECYAPQEPASEQPGVHDTKNWISSHGGRDTMSPAEIAQAIRKVTGDAPIDMLQATMVGPGAVELKVHTGDEWFVGIVTRSELETA